MLFATQFHALAMVVADFLRTEPSVTHKTRDGILLDAERRHHEGVDHIVGGGNDAHLFVDRHHHRVIHLEEVVIHDHTGLGASVIG